MQNTLIKISVGLVSLIVVLGQGCSMNDGNGNRKVSSLSLDELDCVKAQDNYRNPSSFKEIVSLINQLPKPVSLSCFLFNYDPPFEVFAVTNKFSAQPANGQENPRILIIKNNFIITVVPNGDSQQLAEFSLVTGTHRSVKGELNFPIVSSIGPDAAFDRILNVNNNSTRCMGCHFSEVQFIDDGQPTNGFVSNMLAPSQFQRVGSSFLKKEAVECNANKDPERCAILNIIFNNSADAIDTDWPF